MHKTIGAVGNAGVARMGWTFMRDPENPDHKLMLQMKENLGKFSGIKYTTKTVTIPLGGKDVGVAGIEYLGASQATAENIISQGEDFKDKAVQPAINFLKSVLAVGTTLDAAPLIEQAGARGISMNQITRARTALNVRSFKAGNTWKWLREAEGGSNGNGQGNTTVSE